MTTTERPTLKGEILVCEDNHLQQQLICAHLKKAGITTVVAETGKVGVDIVNKRLDNGEKPFDLIFMDMYMPEMDGLEAIIKIRELGLTTPIIPMTANFTATDEQLYKSHGLTDCLRKPFTSQEVWNYLMKYFK